MAGSPVSSTVPADLAALGDAELLARVKAGPVPRHVAIIMDGNGRWAVRRGLPRVEGHRRGVEAARATVRAADALGLGVLTLYAFSSENWSRPSSEVSTLMTLLERSVEGELPDLMASNVRLRVIGRADGVPSAVRRGIERVVSATGRNTGLTLVMAFNYGGRDELVDACRALARRARAGELEPERIDEAAVAGALYTRDLPDPDLLIRTSGEMRVSNFLLWQIAYTELVVTPTLWPDFGARDLYLAVGEYQRRERRFGGSGIVPASPGGA
jgi:undecaprenyl diphosphate synthase